MVRTRIAPSPTGYLHIGTARTALFNYLFAKRNGGQFILRIEDTDTERSKKEFEDDILEGLRWLGITWDEGPDTDGPYGPYRQRDRLSLYKEYLEKLYEKGLLYRCFCSKEDLEKEREIQTLSKQPPKYGGKCRNLTPEEREACIHQGKTSTLRYKIEPQILKVTDLIRGELTFDTNTLDDFIVAKDFDTPLYNFAVVIDDYLMKISHVIRGEEHISNIPKQVLIDQALNFPVPQFAHLSLILNADRTKLSKRQNKVSLLEYREEGYLPEALLNFIAFLGWNPGGTRELFTLSEMGELFDLKQVNKSGAIFDLKKLDWYNNHYIRALESSKITNLALPYFLKVGLLQAGKDSCYTLSETGEKISLEYLERIIVLERERVKKIADFASNTPYFFQKKVTLDPELLKWKEMTTQDVQNSLEFCHRILSPLEDADFQAVTLESKLKEAIKVSEKENGSVLWPLRVALTGLRASPNPFDIAAILGKEKTLQRLADALQHTRVML